MNDITDPRFFAAGNSTFTVSNNKGEHYTFKIMKAEQWEKWFVRLLTGPDNESSYTYLGKFENNRLEMTAKSKMLPDSKPVQVFNWAIKQVNDRKPLPDGYAIQHCGKCGRCGRKLTVPSSIESGFGPECITLI